MPVKYTLYSLLFLILFPVFIAAQTVSGTVTDEDGHVLPAVTVFNMNSKKSVPTNISGEFRIEAAENDEIRFVRNNYDRASAKISSFHFASPLSIVLKRTPEEIEEVQVPNYWLSGNLEDDAQRLAKNNKVEALQKEIGIPKAPEKPREVPSDLQKDILKPLLRIPPSLNIQAIYNVASGKARKQKNLYKYEDLNDDISWIRARLGTDYFTENHIPEAHISEFIQFAFARDPQIRTFIKAKNFSGAMFRLETFFDDFLNQIKK